jgi:hypothetical protein
MGDSGPATAAQLGVPGSLAVAPNGSISLVSQTPWEAPVIRRIAPSGIPSAVAGNPVPVPLTG